MNDKCFDMKLVMVAGAQHSCEAQTQPSHLSQSGHLTHHGLIRNCRGGAAALRGAGVAHKLITLQGYLAHTPITLQGYLAVSGAQTPLSSEHGTHKAVKTIFWPWLSGKSPSNVLSCSLFAALLRGVGDAVVTVAGYCTA